MTQHIVIIQCLFDVFYFLFYFETGPLCVAGIPRVPAVAFTDSFERAFVLANGLHSVSTFIFAAGLYRVSAFVFTTGIHRVSGFVFAANFQRAFVFAAGLHRVSAFVFAVCLQWFPVFAVAFASAAGLLSRVPHGFRYPRVPDR